MDERNEPMASHDKLSSPGPGNGSPRPVSPLWVLGTFALLLLLAGGVMFLLQPRGSVLDPVETASKMFSSVAQPVPFGLVPTEARQLPSREIVLTYQRARATGEAVTLLGDLIETGGQDQVDDNQLGPRVRNATEDLRNWYIEAAAARPGGPASALALANWFWGETAAGALTLALHPIAITSSNASLRAIGERALIPRTQQHRLAR